VKIGATEPTEVNESEEIGSDIDMDSSSSSSPSDEEDSPEGEQEMRRSKSEGEVKIQNNGEKKCLYLEAKLGPRALSYT